MDGDEKKSAVKKRWKVAIEVGIDSDDDEPIGSLLKCKRLRNPKKVKLVLEGGGQRGKKLEVEDEDFGGMDDTLASFRKKLKGPKRDAASGTMRGRNLASDVVDVVECSDPSSVGPVDDGGLDGKSAPRGVEKGDDGSDVTIDMGMQNKRRAKRSNTNSTSKAVADGSESMASGCSLSKDKNESDLLLGEGSSRSSDNRLEDSLSSLLHKQSGLTRKSRMTSSLREKGCSQSLEDELSRSSEDAPGESKPMAVRRSKMASASRLPCKNQKPLELTSEKCRIDNQNLENRLHQASNCTEDNHETNRGPSSAHTVSVEGLKSTDGELSAPLKVIPEDLSPARSHSKVAQDGVLVDPCDSSLDPCNSSKVCNGDSKQLNIVQPIDNCSVPSQMAILKTCNIKNGLKYCSTGDTRTLTSDTVEMRNSLHSAKGLDEIHNLGEDESNKGLAYALPQQSEPQKALKSQNELDSDQCANEHSQHHMSRSTSDQLKMEDTFGNCEGPNTRSKEPDPASGPWEENATMSDGRLPSCTVNSPKAHKSGSDFQLNCQEISLDSCNYQNKSAPVNQDCNSLCQNISSNEGHRATSVPSHDYFFTTEEADGNSSPCVTPDENGSNPEDVVSLPDTENKDSKLSAIQRTLRRPKKRRHGDMAYEGDVDWEVLIDDQSFLEGQRAVYGDRSSRARVKFDSSSSIVTEAESGGAAAISAGLKAYAAGPVEKIKFKEVLKRRGGLQDYLECRSVLLISGSKIRQGCLEVSKTWFLVFPLLVSHFLGNINILIWKIRISCFSPFSHIIL